MWKKEPGKEKEHGKKQPSKWSEIVPPAENTHKNMMLPPPCFKVEMLFYGLPALPFFIQT